MSMPRLLHSSLPALAGVGFKPDHFRAIEVEPQPIGFIEIHAENYLGAGGPPHAQLNRLRSDYALSIHGVGLSVGSPQALDKNHLARVKQLCDRYQPESFSEHLAWSSHDGVFYNDLLPIPYTQERLDQVVAHVDQIQSAFKRRILIENPASYLLFEDSEIPETDFLAEIARCTGCGLLLDITNVFVAAYNHRQDPHAYLADFPFDHVGEIHLSGHVIARNFPDMPDDVTLALDAHAEAVAEPVWELFAGIIAQKGPLPTLVEWDNHVPDWPVLRREAERAGAILDAASTRREAA